MISSFRFYRTPAVHFGPSASEKIPELALSYGKKVLLVTGKSSLNSNGHLESITEKLKRAGLQTYLTHAESEPSPEVIDSAVNTFSSESINLVIAIGGGSVLDAGKAISAMLPLGGNVEKYLEGVGTSIHPGTKVPFIAVPTTAGTGSEATSNAVISRIGGNGFKSSLRHANFTPDIAVVDPLLTISCPTHVTAACGMDALSQLLESLVSTKASQFTDDLVMDALENVIYNIANALDAHKNDTGFRSAMSYGALVSGIALANAGLGAVHGMAPVLGSRSPIPHGIACATLCGPVFRITIEKLIARGDTENTAKLARAGSFADPGCGNDIVAGCEALVKFLYNLTSSFWIPPLKTWGIKENDFDTIASKSSNKNNPAELTRDDFKTILKEKF